MGAAAITRHSVQGRPGGAREYWCDLDNGGHFTMTREKGSRQYMVCSLCPGLSGYRVLGVVECATPRAAREAGLALYNREGS